MPDYAKEYVFSNEQFLLGYKNSKDYVLFTDKKMLLFDRDPFTFCYKKVHVVPYKSISSNAINFLSGKVELLFSLDSGYQLHINFIGMNHDKKENLKMVYKRMMQVMV